MAAKIVKNYPFSEYYAKKAEAGGRSTLDPLLEDDELEEIMVNGTKNVFVHHAKYGICKTNVAFKNERELAELTAKMGFDGKRDFDDFVLKDGSRVNVIVPPAVKETTVTVRKFRKSPFSIIELIEKGTVNAELAAYLWTAVEGLSFFPLNILIAGGTASGKTTLLDALTTFIPPSDRVVTVEDAPELNFQRQNWVQLTTTERLDLPGLVKNSLRMRPDRIIVGDIRGEEAFALFNAMNSGHRGAMGTLHANNDREAIKRLENEPLSVPRTLIPLADIIVVQEIIRDRRKGLIRRVKQVSEISRIEKEIALNPVFIWNIENDKIERTTASSEALAKIARVTHLNIGRVKQITEERRELLEYMLENNVKTRNEVNAFIEDYYKKSFEEEREGVEDGEA